MSEKIKVAWICHLSNATIRNKLKFSRWSPSALIRRILGRKSSIACDFAQWNSNAIREFEKFDDVELHIISPHIGIIGLQEFEANGVYYHFFQSEDDNLFERIKKRLTSTIKKDYSKNTKIICDLIEKIKPDVIHMIGAENPYYSESALSLPKNIPFIVSLQTLLIDPEFITNYPIPYDEYEYRSALEGEILKRADYIATTAVKYKTLIDNLLGYKDKLRNLTLALGEDVTIDDYEKSYDFVYFAASISKAVDYALEAFALAKYRYPSITLHIVGGYDETLMLQLKKRMLELGLGDEVDFTGSLETHDDVIAEIRKARFALLPLKIDLISGTIREAMANGLPVVTTITPATPKLNEERQSVLLCEKGDFQAMADNMCLLLSDPILAQTLQQNAAMTIKERYSNTKNMQEWRDAYYTILQKDE